MNVMIIDDDKSIRTILNMLIHQNALGTVVAQVDNGYTAVSEIMQYQPDIVLIDLLLPGKDGIEIVQEAKQNGYQGKVVMISCVEDVEMISRAYENGVMFYINKPINAIETVSVLKNIKKMVDLEKSMYQIKNLVFSNQTAAVSSAVTQTYPQVQESIEEQLDSIFTEIGIIGLSGTDEIREVLLKIYQRQNENNKNNKYHLKDIYLEVCENLNEEGTLLVKQKNMEQRIRRTIQKALSNIAEMGCEDYYNPIFTKYANVLFDFKQVRQEMQHIKDAQAYAGKINTKKFMEGILSKVDS